MESLIESKALFTTGDIARIFDVNINTVVKWFETGELEGFLLPRSWARRVPREKLLQFMARRRDLVIEPVIEVRPVQIILISNHPGLTRQFLGAVESAFGYDLQVASCAFEVGFLLTKSSPDAIFVHTGHADLDMDEFRKALGSRSRLADAKLIAVLDRGTPGTPPPGFHDGFPLPTTRNKILDQADKVAGLSR